MDKKTKKWKMTSRRPILKSKKVKKKLMNPKHLSGRVRTSNKKKSTYPMMIDLKWNELETTS